MANRLKAMGKKNYANGFDVTLQPHMLDLPLKWRRPSQVFVNSMSDLFHQDVPVAYIKQVFDIMRRADWHQYQVLTKRSDRLRELAPQLRWEPQIWMGVSVENEDYLYRIDDLQRTLAHVKFLSLEPLLGSLHRLNLRGIDWVITGGESGPGARIRDRCIRAGVPFFFKQWGGPIKSRTGRILDGRTWDDMPRTTRVVTEGQFPILPAARIA
jgi:protein gp37